MMAPPIPDPIPQPGETLDAFIARTDPSLASWTERVESSEDIRLAIAYGELSAVFDLAQISRDWAGEAGTEDVLAQFLAGRAGLRRRRDSMRFVRALARERAINTETSERCNEEENHDEP